MTTFNVEEVRFWCRRDTAANWTSVNPILASGEWGVETDNTGATPRKFKMGDGVTAWTSLPYSQPGAFVEDAIADGVTAKAPSQNAVFDALALKANLTGGTFSGDISVPDEAYDATAWNGSLEVPTKNAVRDKIESISGQAAIQLKDEGSNIGSSGAITSIDFVGAGVSAAVAGTAATITIAGGGGSGGVTFLATATVTGSAATTLAMSGLDLSAYKSFLIVGSLDNATASQSNVSLYYNADTTATNYRRELLTAAAATVSAAAGNDGIAIVLQPSETTVFQAFIANDRDSKPRARTFGTEGSTTAMIVRDTSHVWNSATNITGITLSASVANSLAVGSTFSVWGIS